MWHLPLPPYPGPGLPSGGGSSPVRKKVPILWQADLPPSDAADTQQWLQVLFKEGSCTDPGSPSAPTAGCSSPPQDALSPPALRQALLAPPALWQNGLFCLHRSLKLYWFQAIGSPHCADFVINYWSGMWVALASHLVYLAAICSVHFSLYSCPAPTQQQS